MPNLAKSSFRLAIAIPTYNEAKNITKLIKMIKDFASKTGVLCTVLIIDDNSPDGTGEIADKVSEQEQNRLFKVQVLHRRSKQGINKAYIAAFQKLLKENFTHIMQMDADLSHSPKYIPQFIKETSKADFVVGSRYVQGGETPDWELWRKFLSRVGNIYAQVFLGRRIHDYTGGFNLYSAELLRTINPDSVEADGYGFLMELKFRALKYCNKVTEIPIVFTDRKYGVSKIPRNTILTNLFLVPSLKFKNKNP